MRMSEAYAADGISLFAAMSAAIVAVN